MACGPLDELVPLHEELGILAALEQVPVARQRAGLSDAPRLRPPAPLPFVVDASLSGAAGAPFRETAILLQLGWAPTRSGPGIMIGSAIRPAASPSRCRAIRMCCAPNCDGWAERASAWVQQVGVRALFARRLVRGKVYAIDASGLGPGLRLVALVCVSGTRPLIVAWWLLTGTASEQGKEAAVTRVLVEQHLTVLC